MTSSSMVWVNGDLSAAEHARIDPRDRGFTLGDGLFETIRVGSGTVPWIDQHLARLRMGATAIALFMPWDDVQFGRAIADTIRANGLTDGVVRLTISRGVPLKRGLLPGSEPTPTMVITAQSFAGYPGILYDHGMRAMTSRIVRNERSPLTNVKTLSALDQVMARHEAAACGVDEALMCNTSGHLACASAANLFLVVTGTLVTPDTSSGALAGTTRHRVVMELAPLLGLTVTLRMVTVDELFIADEAFLTSTLVGVMPLTFVDGRPIGRGRPGPLTMAMAATLEDSWGLTLTT